MGMERIPIIASLAELPAAIEHGDRVPSSRWYVERRARVLGGADQIPTAWSEQPGEELGFAASGTPALDHNDTVGTLAVSMLDYLSDRLDFDGLTAAIGDVTRAAVEHDHLEDFTNSAHALVASFEASDRFENFEDFKLVDEALTAAVRHVRTPEGADQYGQPIGSVIKPDAPKAKLALERATADIAKDNAILDKMESTYTEMVESDDFDNVTLDDFKDIIDKWESASSASRRHEAHKDLGSLIDDFGDSRGVAPLVDIQDMMQTQLDNELKPKATLDPKVGLPGETPDSSVASWKEQLKAPGLSDKARGKLEKAIADTEAKKPGTPAFYMKKLNGMSDDELAAESKKMSKQLSDQIGTKHGNLDDTQTMNDMIAAERKSRIATRKSAAGSGYDEYDDATILRSFKALSDTAPSGGEISRVIQEGIKRGLGDQMSAINGGKSIDEALKIPKKSAAGSDYGPGAVPSKVAVAANEKTAAKPAPDSKAFTTSGTKSLGTINPAAKGKDPERFEPKVSLADGATPAAGQKVRDAKGRTGTVVETYQAYTAVKWDDGKSQTVANGKLNASDGAAPPAPAGPKAASQPSGDYGPGAIPAKTTVEANKAAAPQPSVSTPKGDLNVGDKVIWVDNGGNIKSGTVTGVSSDIKYGRPGFDIDGSWGYAEQVTNIAKNNAAGKAAAEKASGLSQTERMQLGRMLYPRAKAAGRSALLKKASDQELQDFYDSASSSMLHTQSDFNAWSTIVKGIETEMKRRGMERKTSARYTGQN